ncbi:MAG TPA: transposase, partial [Planctomycetaceae bacterium]|nr:transposase [Planctomycetaceae bacterium]
DIELRWLPTACPELNPVENLWRWLKGSILCNHQPEDFADTTHTAIAALEQLSLRQALTLSGALSKNFWLGT